MSRKTLKYANMDCGNVQSYEQIERALYLEDGKWRANRPIQRNTFLSRTPSGIALSFYGNPLIVWHSDNMVTLNSHEYYTLTTRQRISTWLPEPLNIYDSSGYWWLTLPRGNRPFHDGMIIDLETLAEFGPVYDISSTISSNREWETKIAAYMHAWARTIPWRKGTSSDPATVITEYFDPEPLVNLACIGQTTINGRHRSYWEVVNWYVRFRLLRGAYTQRKKQFNARNYPPPTC